MAVVRKVRTPEGAKFYGQPIGSIIVPNAGKIPGLVKGLKADISTAPKHLIETPKKGSSGAEVPEPALRWQKVGSKAVATAFGQKFGTPQSEVYRLFLDYQSVGLVAKTKDGWLLVRNGNVKATASTKTGLAAQAVDLYMVGALTPDGKATMPDPKVEAADIAGEPGTKASLVEQAKADMAGYSEKERDWILAAFLTPDAWSKIQATAAETAPLEAVQKFAQDHPAIKAGDLSGEIFGSDGLDAANVKAYFDSLSVATKNFLWMLVDQGHLEGKGWTDYVKPLWYDHGLTTVQVPNNSEYVGNQVQNWPDAVIESDPDAQPLEPGYEQLEFVPGHPVKARADYAWVGYVGSSVTGKDSTDWHSAVAVAYQTEDDGYVVVDGQGTPVGNPQALFGSQDFRWTAWANVVNARNGSGKVLVDSDTTVDGSLVANLLGVKPTGSFEGLSSGAQEVLRVAAQFKAAVPNYDDVDYVKALGTDADNESRAAAIQWLADNGLEQVPETKNLYGIKPEWKQALTDQAIPAWEKELMAHPSVAEQTFGDLSAGAQKLLKEAKQAQVEQQNDSGELVDDGAAIDFAWEAVPATPDDYDQAVDWVSSHTLESVPEPEKVPTVSNTVAIEGFGGISMDVPENSTLVVIDFGTGSYYASGYISPGDPKILHAINGEDYDFDWYVKGQKGKVWTANPLDWSDTPGQPDLLTPVAAPKPPWWEGQDPETKVLGQPFNDWLGTLDTDQFDSETGFVYVSNHVAGTVPPSVGVVVGSKRGLMSVQVGPGYEVSKTVHVSSVADINYWADQIEQFYHPNAGPDTWETMNFQAFKDKSLAWKLDHESSSVQGIADKHYTTMFNDDEEVGAQGLKVGALWYSGTLTTLDIEDLTPVPAQVDEPFGVVTDTGTYLVGSLGDLKDLATYQAENPDSAFGTWPTFNIPDLVTVGQESVPGSVADAGPGSVSIPKAGGGSLEVSTDTVAQAISVLEAAKGMMIKQPLSKADNPLWESDYHAIAQPFQGQYAGEKFHTKLAYLAALKKMLADSGPSPKKQQGLPPNSPHAKAAAKPALIPVLTSIPMSTDYGTVYPEIPADATLVLVSGQVKGWVDPGDPNTMQYPHPWDSEVGVTTVDLSWYVKDLEVTYVKAGDWAAQQKESASPKTVVIPDFLGGLAQDYPVPADAKLVVITDFDGQEKPVGWLLPDQPEELYYPAGQGGKVGHSPLAEYKPAGGYHFVPASDWENAKAAEFQGAPEVAPGLWAYSTGSLELGGEQWYDASGTKVAQQQLIADGDSQHPGSKTVLVFNSNAGSGGVPGVPEWNQGLMGYLVVGADSKPIYAVGWSDQFGNDSGIFTKVDPEIFDEPGASYLSIPDFVKAVKDGTDKYDIAQPSPYSAINPYHGPSGTLDIGKIYPDGSLNLEGQQSLTGVMFNSAAVVPADAILVWDSGGLVGYRDRQLDGTPGPVVYYWSGEDAHGSWQVKTVSSYSGSALAGFSYSSVGSYRYAATHNLDPKGFATNSIDDALAWKQPEVGSATDAQELVSKAAEKAKETPGYPSEYDAADMVDATSSASGSAPEATAQALATPGGDSNPFSPVASIAPGRYAKPGAKGWLDVRADGTGVYHSPGGKDTEQDAVAVRKRIDKGLALTVPASSWPHHGKVSSPKAKVVYGTFGIKSYEKWNGKHTYEQFHGPVYVVQADGSVQKYGEAFQADLDYYTPEILTAQEFAQIIKDQVDSDDPLVPRTGDRVPLFSDLEQMRQAADSENGIWVGGRHVTSADDPFFDALLDSDSAFALWADQHSVEPNHGKLGNVVNARREILQSLGLEVPDPHSPAQPGRYQAVGPFWVHSQTGGTFAPAGVIRDLVRGDQNIPVKAADESSMISRIVADLGLGGILFNHKGGLNSNQKYAWLNAFKAGNFAQIKKLEKASGNDSPELDFLPDHVYWESAVPSEVPAGMPIPGQWSSISLFTTTGGVPSTEIDNYLLAAKCAYPEYLTENERRSWVWRHRSGDGDKLAALSLKAKTRMLAGEDPKTHAPVYTPGLKPAKTWTAVVESGQVFVPGSAVPYSALSDWYADEIAGKALLEVQGKYPGHDKFWEQLAGGILFDLDVPGYNAWIGARGAQATWEAEQAKIPVFSPSSPPPGLKLGDSTHPLDWVQDQHGKKWVFKSMPDAYRVEAELMATKVAKLYGFSMPEATAVVNGEGPAGVQHSVGNKTGFVSVYAPNKGTLEGVDVASLTGPQLTTLVQDHVLDWLLDNDDSRAANYMIGEDGQIIAIDKSRTMKHFGKWKGLAGDASANTNASLVSTKIFDAIRHHEISQDQAQALYRAAVAKAQKIQDSPWAPLEGLIQEGMAHRTYWYPGDPIHDVPTLLAAVKARKDQLADDIDSVWAKVFEQAGYEKPPVPKPPAKGRYIHVDPQFDVNLEQTRILGQSVMVGGSDWEEGHIHFWTEQIAKQRVVRAQGNIFGPNHKKLYQDLYDAAGKPGEGQNQPKKSPQQIKADDVRASVVDWRDKLEAQFVQFSKDHSNFVKQTDTGVQVSAKQIKDAADNGRLEWTALLEQWKADPEVNEAYLQLFNAQVEAWIDSMEKELTDAISENRVTERPPLYYPFLPVTDDPEKSQPSWAKLWNTVVDKYGKEYQLSPDDPRYSTPPSEAEVPSLIIAPEPEQKSEPKNPWQELFPELAEQGITIKVRQTQGTSGSLNPETLELTSEDGKGLTQGWKGYEYVLTLPSGEEIMIAGPSNTISSSEYDNGPPFGPTPYGQPTLASRAGMVRFQANPGQSAQSMWQQIAPVLAQLGISADQPSDDELKVLYYRMLAGSFQHRKSPPVKYQQLLENYKAKVEEVGGKVGHDDLPPDALQGLMSTKDEVAFWEQQFEVVAGSKLFAAFQKAEGWRPRFDTDPRTGLPVGHPHWYRVDEDPVKVMESGIWLQQNGMPATAFAYTGMQSTDERTRILGSWLTDGPWSPDSDQSYGSGTVVYTKPGDASPSSGSNSAILSPLAAMRIGAYGFITDTYGKPFERKENTPFSAVQMLKQCAAEIVPKWALWWGDVYSVKCHSSAERNELIQKFKDAGVTEIRGIPVEDFFVLSGSTKAYENYQKQKAQITELIASGGWL